MVNGASGGFGGAKGEARGATIFHWVANGGKGMGGAIFLAKNAALAMHNVTFQNNHASPSGRDRNPASFGGGLYVWDGAVAQYTGSVSYLQNSALSGNNYWVVPSGKYQEVSAPYQLLLVPQDASASTLSVSTHVSDSSGRPLVMTAVYLTVPTGVAVFPNGKNSVTAYTGSTGSVTTTLTFKTGGANFQLFAAASGTATAQLNVVNNSAIGAPAPSPRSELTGYASSDRLHVYFVGVNNHVYEMSYKDRWVFSDLTEITGAPYVAPGGRLKAFLTSFNNLRHVIYADAGGHIHELWFGNQWYHNDLTALAGAPNTAAGSALNGYETAYNNQQHINFIGADNHVHELWWNGAWHHHDLTKAAGAPAAAPGSDLSGYATTFNNQHHVNFIGADNHVYELFWDSVAWYHHDLTKAAGAPAAAPGSDLSSYATTFNNQQHVDFIGADNHVHELWFDTAWHHNDLTAAAGAPPAAPGSDLSGYATTFNNQQHVTFISADNHIHDLVYDVNWRDIDLTLRTLSPAPPNASQGSPLAGYPSSFNRQQHVVYIGLDNRIHELWFDGVFWRAADLTGVTAFQ